MSYQGVHFQWRGFNMPKHSRAGVSLHTHTLHSRECLGTVARYALRIPVFSRLIRREMERYKAVNGEEMDFTRIYWTPPLSARQAWNKEQRQIENLDFSPVVSLSDHDDIRGPSLLLSLDRERRVPISFEWTVPYGPTYFHLGVHNLPADRSVQLERELCAYRERPDGALLAELLSALHEHDDVLVVLNHPFWNQALIDPSEHDVLTEAFLQQCGRWIHAIELNALRSWKENARAIELAESCGMPVVSGGDSHTSEPAAAINLTHARTFGEFARELRVGRASTVLFLNRYREPLRLRKMESVWDILRDHPNHPYGLREWKQRVFFRERDGTPRPLSSFAIFARRMPRPVAYFLTLMDLLQNPRLRPALRFALFNGERAL